MRTVHLFVTSCLALAAGSACLGSSEPGGPKLAVDIAALTLTGPDNVCYDLLVENADGPVWSKGNPLLTLLGADQTGGTVTGAADTDTICSTRYGNSDGGDVTYIGTCDSSSDSDLGREEVQNRVTVWVDGIYKSGADLGDWQDPCEDGCSLSVDCNENEDSRVEFNLTLMRQANQGFFDIAVNFEDIFCSAKFDNCYPDGDDAGTDDDNITLLHGADQVRDWTGVVGFACSAGSDATQTNLLYGPFTVTCGNNVFAIDPSVDEGNDSVAGSAGGVLHYGVYRGTEQLDCGTGVGSCKKVFWNVAFSIQDLEALGGSCTLAVTATANDNNQGFELGLPKSVGVTYPYIEIATTLTNNGAGICQRNALNVIGSGVQTQYRGNLNGVIAPIAMCHQFNGTTVSATGGCGVPPGPCPSGTYGTPETACLPCDASCATCSGPGADACTSCADGWNDQYYGYEGFCVLCDGPTVNHINLGGLELCVCHDGYYGNPIDGCLPCDSECGSVTCSGPTLAECCHSSCNNVGCSGPGPNDCTPQLYCGDGIQNGTETGVDCGGPEAYCPERCPPTCIDGIQNGTESAIDCGGVSSGVTCPACPVDDCTIMKAQSYEPNPTGWSMPADASGCYFDLTSLVGADLTGADLTGATMGEMDLSSSVLINANFTDAIIIRTIFTNANLTGANFTNADLTGPMIWSGATCPDGVVVDGAAVTSCSPDHLTP